MTHSATAITETLLKHKPQTVNILGVRINNVTMTETLALLEAMALNGKAYQVVTVNPEFIMMAQSDEPFRQVLNNASLSIPDAIGVVWASRLLGKPILERVAGVDVVENFARVAERNKLRLFLLGASPGIAERAAAKLQEQNPGLIIAGIHAGSPRTEEEQAICQRIQAAAPHVLLVAYGPPQQDLWIARNLHRFNTPIIGIGVGGTFDFIAGVVVRAPRCIQRVGLEWLHRLIHQPWRWRRMLTLPHFGMSILLQCLIKNSYRP